MDGLEIKAYPSPHPAYALDCGSTSDENEIEIPAEVLAALEQYAEKYS